MLGFEARRETLLTGQNLAALSMKPQKPEVTELLKESARGDRAALDQLLPLVYNELRGIADRYLRRERPDHTLQTTALINEVYLRFAGQKGVRWQDRAHFFAAAATLMRRVLIDHARGSRYLKRGGGARKVALEEAAVLSPERASDLVALDEALGRLAAVDARKARVVELRYFGGLSVEEAAEVLGVSQVTVMRDWALARAWLRREMGGGKP